MTEEIISVLQPWVERNGRERHYNRGDILISLGAPMDRFMILREGRAKLIVKSGESRAFLLCFTRENEILGDLEFFSPGPSTVTAVAVTPCSVLSVDMDSFRGTASGSTELLQVLGNSIAYKLRRANSKNAVNIMYPLRERLAGYLYHQISGTSGEDLSGDSLVDIAELLGTSYRHLNRVISGLCVEGILRRTKWGLTVGDRKKLETLAGDIYLY